MFWNAKKFNQNLDSWGDKLPEGCKIGYWFKFVAFSPIDGEDKKPKWFVTTEDGLLKKNQWHTSAKIEKDFWYLTRDKNLDKWQVKSDCRGVEGMFEGTPLEENPPKWYKKIADKN